MKIGFIGQGFIGKNLADNFEERGIKDIVRFSMEDEYVCNKELIKKCEIVFLAVPTPTTSEGFDDSIIREVLKIPRDGATIVIKSTILPGSAREYQKMFPKKIIIHNPEFLTEKTAKFDTDSPERNIIGISNPKSMVLQRKAREVLDVLPESKFEFICGYEEAAIIKYSGNCFFYVKNMFFNLVYDLSAAYDADWETIRNAIIADNRIDPVHTEPFHKGGRGAGGHCLIKDMAAFRMVYEDKLDDLIGKTILRSNENKNISLLKKSSKDMALLSGVYGEDSVKKF